MSVQYGLLTAEDVMHVCAVWFAHNTAGVVMHVGAVWFAHSREGDACQCSMVCSQQRR